MELELKCLAAGVRLERANKRHAREFARQVRPQDKAEVWASGKLMPEQAARGSINRSIYAYAGYAEDRSLLAVFGIVDYRNGWAAPWALSTIHVDTHPLTFWRASKIILAHMRDSYPQMVQMIDSHYTSALRWIERLGFTLEGAEPHGWQKRLFCRAQILTPRLILEAG